MDNSTIDDHAWDALVAGAASGLGAGGAGSTAPCGDGGFQVLSLEQYAASHARSLHQVNEQHRLQH